MNKTYIHYLERQLKTFSPSDLVLPIQNYLDSNSEFKSLLFEYHQRNIYSYNETLTPKYIKRDLERFITFLKERAERENPK